MKPNKVFLEFLITLSLLFMPIAISENVYASESDVRMWCMNIPLTRTFQSPYAFIHNHDFTFECDDGCGISSRFVGMGWQDIHTHPGLPIKKRLYSIKELNPELVPCVI